MSGYPKGEYTPLPIGKNEKGIGLMKDELGGKIMIEFVPLRAKMYVYRKIDHLAAQHEYKEVWGESAAKVQKSVWFLKVLRLMTIRPAYLMVKQYTGGKCCLRIRSTRCTRLISIR